MSAVCTRGYCTTLGHVLMSVLECKEGRGGANNDQPTPLPQGPDSCRWPVGSPLGVLRNYGVPDNWVVHMKNDFVPFFIIILIAYALASVGMGPK